MAKELASIETILERNLFSDCTVLSENASPIGLFHLLAAATALSLTLMESGLFVRGGIAKGHLHHSDKAVFGPALLDAYRMESTIARFPRILIDKATHADYRRTEFLSVRPEKGVSPKVSFDEDGPPFLDILYVIKETDAELEEKIAKCRTEIQKALDESVYEPKHYDKLRWLAIYWNGVAIDRGAATIRLPLIDNLEPEA